MAEIGVKTWLAIAAGGDTVRLIPDLCPHGGPDVFVKANDYAALEAQLAVATADQRTLIEVMHAVSLYQPEGSPHPGGPVELTMWVLRTLDERRAEARKALVAADIYIHTLQNDISNRVYRAEEQEDPAAFEGIDDGKYNGDWESIRASMSDAFAAIDKARGADNSEPKQT